jgi:hypothetical protein
MENNANKSKIQNDYIDSNRDSIQMMSVQNGHLMIKNSYFLFTTNLEINGQSFLEKCREGNILLNQGLTIVSKITSIPN